VLRGLSDESGFWKTIWAARRMRASAVPQQVARAVQRCLRRQPAVINEALADLLADRQRRVEHGERILEHDGDAGAAYPPSFFGIERQQVGALEQDTTADDLGFRPEQAH